MNSPAKPFLLAVIAVNIFGCGVVEDADHLGSAKVEQEVSVSYAPGKELQALETLNLRELPNRDAKILDQIPQWVRVTTARDGGAVHGYYKVNFHGREGWAYGALLQSESAGAQLVRWGIYPDASDAMRRLEISSGDIAQTIGNAPASAGYHLADGMANGAAYCAATDIWVAGMTDHQIRVLLEQMGRRGFAGWCRGCGNDGWTGPKHIHTVYVGAAHMKSQLQAQVHSWLAGNDGLTGDGNYEFYKWSEEAKNEVRRIFFAVH